MKQGVYIFNNETDFLNVLEKIANHYEKTDRFNYLDKYLTSVKGVRTEIDGFSAHQIHPGHGRLHIREDKHMMAFESRKAYRMWSRKRNPRKIAWTEHYRHDHKKSVADMEVKRNIVWRSALSSGIHEYEYVVENEAGRSSFKKVLGCYPMKPFSVKVFGKQYVRLQIPPPPPGVADVITQTLQFEIRVPPENDPIVLNKVVVNKMAR